MSHEIRVTMNKKSKGPPRIPTTTGGPRKSHPRLGTLEDESQQPQQEYTSQPSIPSARRSRILLYLCLTWLAALTFVFVARMLWVPPPPPPPIFSERKDQSKWRVPFTLVPDAESNGRIMTLRITQLNFSQVLRYDVCCRKGNFYVCRAVSKNLGVDCYLTSENSAVFYINHPDMVGARCTLLWSENRT